MVHPLPYVGSDRLPNRAGEANISHKQRPKSPSNAFQQRAMSKALRIPNELAH
jgi:hypothetical protein